MTEIKRVYNESKFVVIDDTWIKVDIAIEDMQELCERKNWRFERW